MRFHLFELLVRSSQTKCLMFYLKLCIYVCVYMDTQKSIYIIAKFRESFFSHSCENRLCMDAFSYWISAMPRFKTHDRRIFCLTFYIFGSAVILLCVQWLYVHILIALYVLISYNKRPYRTPKIYYNNDLIWCSQSLFFSLRFGSKSN